MMSLYRDRLGISEKDIHTIEWSEVVSRFLELQNSGRYVFIPYVFCCTDTCNLTTAVVFHTLCCSCQCDGCLLPHLHSLLLAFFRYRVVIHKRDLTAHDIVSRIMVRDIMLCCMWW